MSEKSIPGVRIVLDLELFFKDKRRKCYHYIDFSKNKIVGDVCNDIKSNFDVNTDIFLEINKCYVPEKQDVRVLYNEDVVRVVDAGRCVPTNQNDTCVVQKHVSQDPEILTRTLADRRNETMPNQVAYESEENIIVSKPKKRKKSKIDETEKKKDFKEFIDVYEGENPKRKKKSLTNLSSSICGECEKFSHRKNEREPDALNNSTAVLANFTCKDASTEICNDTKTESESTSKLERALENVCSSPVELHHEQTCKVDSEEDSFVSSATVKMDINDGEKKDLLLNSESHAEESEHLNNSFCKKKRRRRRKPSRIERNYSEQHATEFVTKHVAISSFKTPQHIKFVDEDEHTEFSNNTKPNISSNNELDKCVLLQLTAESESSLMDNGISTKNENNIKLDSYVPINKTANVRNSNISDNFVNQTSTTPMIFECKKTNRMSSNQSVSKETETDFSKYPVLHKAPKENDIIAFKKLKMDSDYCPNISCFISAKVLQVSENDNTILLQILNGSEELKEPKGKFSLEEENEDDFEKKLLNDPIEMNLPELLDIRLLFP